MWCNLFLLVEQGVQLFSTIDCQFILRAGLLLSFFCYFLAWDLGSVTNDRTLREDIKRTIITSIMIPTTIQYLAKKVGPPRCERRNQALDFRGLKSV